MKFIFAYLIPCVLLGTTMLTVLIGRVLFRETEQYRSNWIVILLIIILTMMAITLRDWSLGKLPKLMLEKMEADQPGPLRTVWSILSGGIGAVVTYVIFSTLIARAFLPLLGNGTIYIGGFLGILVLMAYARGAYLFFSYLKART